MHSPAKHARIPLFVVLGLLLFTPHAWSDTHPVAVEPGRSVSANFGTFELAIQSNGAIDNLRLTDGARLLLSAEIFGTTVGNKQAGIPAIRPRQAKDDENPKRPSQVRRGKGIFILERESSLGNAKAALPDRVAYRQKLTVTSAGVLTCRYELAYHDPKQTWDMPCFLLTYLPTEILTGVPYTITGRGRVAKGAYPRLVDRAHPFQIPSGTKSFSVALPRGTLSLTAGKTCELSGYDSRVERPDRTYLRIDARPDHTQGWVRSKAFPANHRMTFAIEMRLPVKAADPDTIPRVKMGPLSEMPGLWVEPVANLVGGRVDVAGVVFLDTNRNGRRDRGEKPLEGICVSDSDRIIRTKRDGRYAFSFDLDVPTCVFITEPTGYRASGSYYWLATTGTHRRDFGLILDPPSSDRRFSFIDGGDIQYRFTRQPQQLAYDFQSLPRIEAALNARFSVWPGDLTPYGQLDNLTLLKRNVKQLPNRFYPVFGGHDGLKSWPTKQAHYMQIMGPSAYAWNYGGVHFVGLVSELDNLNEKERQRQARWFQRDLALQPRGTPVIVATHIPAKIGPMILKAVSAHNLKLVAVLQAHYHCHNLMMCQGVPVFCSAPWRAGDMGAFTKKCRVILYDKGALQSSVRVIGQEKRLTILSPQGDMADGPFRVAVNAYDTVLKVDSVTFRITADNAPPVRGRLKQRGDWTWSLPLPETLSPGAYRISATAHAADRQWRTQAAFTVGRPTRAPLRLAWLASTGNTLYYFGSPVIDRNKIFLGLHDGQFGCKRAGVICLDLADGSTLWRTRTDDDINSTLCLVKDNVYALSNTGMLFRLSASTGKILSKQNMCEGAAGQPFQFNMALAPLAAASGRIFGVTFGDYRGSFLFCADAASGKKLWSASGLFRHAYPIVGVVPSAHTVYFAGTGGYGAARAGTGDRIWSKKVQRERSVCTPAAVGGSLYIHHRRNLRKVAASDGALAWCYPGPRAYNYMGIPAVGAGKVVIATGDRIEAIDDTTGKRLWSFKTPLPGALIGAKYEHAINGSSPVLVGDLVYVGADNGIFYALDARNGRSLFGYKVGVPVKASPAVSEKWVVVSAFDGNVYAFQRCR